MRRGDGFIKYGCSSSMLHIILIWLPEKGQVQCPDFLHAARYFMLGAKYVTIVNMKRKCLC